MNKVATPARLAPLRLVELYAGTARSAEHFRYWKGCRVALLVDNDALARDTYIHNFPAAPYIRRDLERASPGEVETLAGGRVDILLGCPPCQGFSDTGVRDPDDPRNAHLLRFAYFGQALRPLAIAMENVPLAGEARQFKAFVDELERAGYAWTAGIVNAALRGSAQCRQRLVYIALHRDLGVTPRIRPGSHGGDRRYFCYRDGLMKKLSADQTAMLGEAPATQRLRRTLPLNEEGLGQRPIPYVEEVLRGLPQFGFPAASRRSGASLIGNAAPASRRWRACLYRPQR